MSSTLAWAESTPSLSGSKYRPLLYACFACLLFLATVWYGTPGSSATASPWLRARADPRVPGPRGSCVFPPRPHLVRSCAWSNSPRRKRPREIPVNKQNESRKPKVRKRLHTNTRHTAGRSCPPHDDTAHTGHRHRTARTLLYTRERYFPPALSARPRPSQIHAPMRRRRPRRRLPDRARGPHSVELVLLHALAAHLEVGRREGGLLRRAQPVLVSWG